MGGEIFDIPTLYSRLYCELCDRPTSEPHLSFCRQSRSGDRRIDWESVRLYVLNRDGWTCQYCGHSPEYEELAGTYPGLHVDHVRPRSAGGTDVPWNLVTACERCNLTKGPKIPHWLADYEARRARREAALEEAYYANLGAFD
jgi:5-methylcytosine-specific restriction endonuclease McrA